MDEVDLRIGQQLQPPLVETGNRVDALALSLAVDRESLVKYVTRSGQIASADLVLFVIDARDGVFRRGVILSLSGIAALPLLPIGASVFCLSALFYFHVNHGTVNPSSPLQRVIASMAAFDAP